MLKIYDTRTREKQPLQSDDDGTVRMYVCGVTVYDRVHLGHARSYLVFDALVRFLSNRGHHVRYVRNFTDVDDKIIERARENDEEPLALSGRMIDAFHEDMGDLGLLLPEVEPKVSEHIPQILDLVASLIQRDHAYVVEGDVYFSGESWSEYGELSGRRIDEQREGARVDVDERKRHPFDFALWKSARPGEPTWDSPWGPGRPGWHIECSAMSMEYLGDSFHLHGGGDDLIFPHHENEIAQSRAGTDGEFAQLWMHNGMVTTDGEKMSKSLGNFWTLRDVLEHHDPEVIRQFALSKHYRKPVDYNDKSLHDATEGMRKLYRALAHLEGRGEGQQDTSVGDESAVLAAHQAISECEDRIVSALEDDFNTGMALGQIFEFARTQVRAIDALDGADPAVGAVAHQSGLALRRWGSWLGMLGRDLERFDASVASRREKVAQINTEEIDDLVLQRTEARGRKDWAEADRIRDLLVERGIELKDGPEGTSWVIT